MLAGIYYGAMYGAHHSILLMSLVRQLRSSPVSMVIKWHKRKAGPALAIVAIGSFIAGTIGIFGLVFLALHCRGSIGFGPPEYFSLMVLVLLF